MPAPRELPEARDTAPNRGRDQGPDSAAWRELVGSVRALGEDERRVTMLVASTLAALFAVLPARERAHVRSHLPLDVLGHLDDVVQVGHPEHLRGADDVVAVVAGTAHVRPGRAELAVRQVFATLRDLVPEGETDIEAVLPGDLPQLWRPPRSQHVDAP